MPEIVEVRISSELLRPLVVNHNLLSISPTKTGRYKDICPNGLTDMCEEIGKCRTPPVIIDVAVKGKFMYWTISNEDKDYTWYMFCTFGMTGQWSPREGDHPCMRFYLVSDKGRDSEVFFNDPRHFGTIRFTKSKEELQKKLNEELGWDAMQESVESKISWVNKQIGGLDKPIGQVLLDQSIFAGVGNYIRAEALYHAQISPWRKCSDLSLVEIEKICQSIAHVALGSYTYQGATILTYRNAYGEKGKYSSCFKVYGQKTDPLGNVIKKEKTPEGRTIHWCPNVQL